MCVNHMVSARWRTTSFICAVRGHPDKRFGQTWIGCGGPIAARSPDLTPLHSFLWGQMKSLVYETSVDSEEDSMAQIMAFISALHTYPSKHHLMEDKT